MWKWKLHTNIWNDKLTINFCCRHRTIICQVNQGPWYYQECSLLVQQVPQLDQVSDWEAPLAHWDGVSICFFIVDTSEKYALYMEYSMPLRAQVLVFPSLLLQPDWYGIYVYVCASICASALVLVYEPPWISCVNIPLRAHLTVSGSFFIYIFYHLFGFSTTIQATLYLHALVASTL